MHGKDLAGFQILKHYLNGFVGASFLMACFDISWINFPQVLDMYYKSCPKKKMEEKPCKPIVALGDKFGDDLFECLSCHTNDIMEGLPFGYMLLVKFFNDELLDIIEIELSIGWIIG